ncbi:hypothetical protein G3I76_10020 [Streptomyces sp. SID11233]|nr:hypothetical protein [Streptomyces sp. SID11233]
MSTEQHEADAYGQELARISHYQSEAIEARFTVFQVLAAVGIGHEQADDIVAKLEAGAVAGAHTWISESSAPHKSEPRFEDGWHAGVRDVARGGVCRGRARWRMPAAGTRTRVLQGRVRQVRTRCGGPVQPS